MAPHSSTFAWKIPWTEEPGRLQSMESLQSDTIERLHKRVTFKEENEDETLNLRKMRKTKTCLTIGN